MRMNNSQKRHLKVISFLMVLLASVVVGPLQLMAGEAKTVFVSILPQKFFVEQISGDYLNVEVMVKPGASPATYEPKSSQMRKLAETDAYFAIGVPFEKTWLKRIEGVNPHMQVIHTDKGIEKLAMAAHSHEHEEHEAEHDHENGHHEEVDDHDHSKGDHHDKHHDKDEHSTSSMHHGEEEHEEGHHEEEGLDPHIWLSPTLVKQQARVINATLTGLYPEHKGAFSKNLELFLSRIDTLNQELAEVLQDKKGMKFMVFHPSWGYFAQEYGLEQVAIEIEGKNPKPAQLKELIAYARNNDIRVIFAQPQFSTKSAGIVAKEIGGTVVLIDPLAEDWQGNLHKVAEQIKKGLK